MNRVKEKIHVIISIDKEKAFDKFQHPFIILKKLKLGIKGIFLYLINGIY